MFRAIILPSAKNDIKDAAHWYNSRQKGLGKRFTQEVRDKVLSIRKNPKFSTIRYESTRCAVLDVFPFMIHYSVEHEKKIIIIVGVFHTSLNPSRWENRK